MTQPSIKDIVNKRVTQDGLFETGISGVKLFRVTTPIPCAPAVYEPCVVAIASGDKEAVFDGKRHHYDHNHYLCCPTSMPAQAGTPNASPDNPLIGVYISLNAQVVTELASTMAATNGATGSSPQQGIMLARWDDQFGDALLRLLALIDDRAAIAALGDARLRELYFTILCGGAGEAMRANFGETNKIAQSISHLSANIDAPVSIGDLATNAGMSRAVFHRKFKQATSMSPIQFVKAMRLNNAANKIAGGVPVSEAAMDVGYVSTSRFSREFKRAYGQSPRAWSSGQIPNLQLG